MKSKLKWFFLTFFRMLLAFPFVMPALILCLILDALKLERAAYFIDQRWLEPWNHFVDYGVRACFASKR